MREWQRHPQRGLGNGSRSVGVSTSTFLFVRGVCGIHRGIVPLVRGLAMSFFRTARPLLLPILYSAVTSGFLNLLVCNSGHIKGNGSCRSAETVEVRRRVSIIAIKYDKDGKNYSRNFNSDKIIIGIYIHNTISRKQ